MASFHSVVMYGLSLSLSYPHLPNGHVLVWPSVIFSCQQLCCSWADLESSCNWLHCFLTYFINCSWFPLLTFRKVVTLTVWRFNFDFMETYTIRWSISPKFVTPANCVISSLLVRITSTGIWDEGVTLVGSNSYANCACPLGMHSKCSLYF